MQVGEDQKECALLLSRSRCGVQNMLAIGGERFFQSSFALSIYLWMHYQTQGFVLQGRGHERANRSFSAQSRVRAGDTLLYPLPNRQGFVVMLVRWGRVVFMGRMGRRQESGVRRILLPGDF